MSAIPTILIVDDEQANVELLEELLEQCGYNTLCAYDGQQALDVLEHERCDAMLLDIHMPVLDGFAVLERLSGEGGPWGALPVIVISAYDDMETIVRSIRLGAEDHLSKPFHPLLLQARISSALEKRRLRDQIARQLAITREIFGKYVPEDIAKRILEGGGTLAPVKTTASVLFTDIVGFTGLVESMVPEHCVRMLNEYFEALIEPIRRHGGVVNQFQGDAMLVTFNVPVEDPLHVEHAVQTALEIQHLVATDRFAGVALPTRIGIATGEVVAGNVGSGDRIAYTVHGDTVNLAARLEQLNKSCDTSLLLCAATAAALGQEFDVQLVDSVDIRGKQLPVDVYTVGRQL